MNNASQSIRVALFFLVGVAMIWIAWTTLTDSRLGSGDGYRLRAEFADLQQLQVGSEVRMAGVRIGNVVSTDLDGTRGVATLYIENKYRVPADSEATILTAGLLGTSYVSIKAGESIQVLAQGDRIKTFDTPGLNEVIADVGRLGEKLESVFEKVDGALKGFAGGEAGPGDLFSNLNSLVTENRERIDTILTNFQQISSQIAEGKGTLGRLISDDTAYEQLLATASDIRKAADGVNSFMQDGQGIMDEIKSGKGVIGALLYDEQAAENLRRSIANVESFTTKLNDPNNSLGRLLANDDLYIQVQGTLTKVESAVGRLDDSGPITAVGVLATALF